MALKKATKKATKKTAAKTTTKPKQENYQVPRGMRDLFDERVHLYQGFFEKASEVAQYYGFKPIETPVVEDESVFVRGVGETTDIIEKELYTLKTKGGSKLALRPEFTAGVMRSYLAEGMQSHPQPVMLYSHGPVFRHDRPQRGRFRDPRQFNLEVIGTEKSIGDAVVIHVNNVILKEVGLENIRFDINSIGDKESRANYLRELTNFYKKHLSTLNKECADCATRFKENPLRLLDCKNNVCSEIKQDAPGSINYLNESSKKHFKETLEYLEALGIPYMINNHLVRGLDYYSRTVFEIFVEGKETTEGEEAPKPLAIGGGGRYDYLARQLGSKKEVPSVGSALGVDRIIDAEGYNKPMPRIVKKPKVFFIQLGYEAKLKSLNVIEALRAARVPVQLSPSKDSLGSQLGTAERLKIPYAIILGQKEVLDNTVIIRNMSNRSQKVVQLDKLVDAVKEIK